MTTGLGLACLLAQSLVLALAAPAEDKVSSLPGWSGDLPSTWYSGYLSFGVKHLHYVLVEAETSPQTAPVVLWMNGGPGCSSMDGLFYEHGPLLVNEGGSALVRNNFAWSKLATMLYLEAPVGVGYSYSENKTDLEHLNDEQTASDNLQALKVFFSLYPELKSRDFYVSGESYAGVYVPTLSHKIFQDSSVDWNMKGFIVGNGIFSWKLMQASTVPFLYGHGAISSRAMKKIDTACHGDYVKNVTEECEQLVNKAQQASQGLNFYDFYRDCFQKGDAQSNGILTGREIGKKPELLLDLVQRPRPVHPALMADRVGEDVPCIDSVGGTEYLGRSDVRSALHIASSLPGWAICSGSIAYSRNMSYFAPEHYRAMKDKYKILVYNGDTDMACDYVADQWGVDLVGAEVDSKMDWVPWKVSKGDGSQISGFITKYVTKGPGMYFATVKGAGHMVPQWKPQEASELLDRFLNNHLGEESEQKSITV
mmetsp:Transcript_62711/g.149608  ORF Transcript_62711/g.149608 Transcript_62711/m.149608 type:complete len:481 (-) Transcript_62711:246-1688(-)